MAQPGLIPTFSPTPRAGDFLQGAVLPLKAAGVILRSGKLRGLAMLSGLITFVSLIALLWLLGVYTDDLLRYFWSTPESWWGKGLWYVVLVLAFLGLLVIGMNTVPLALQAPLQDPMSEATEELCGDFQAPGFTVGALVKGVSVGLAHTLTRIAILLAGQALLFPLNFIPGIGSIVWTVLSATWTIVWAAGEHLGGPMARHLYPFSAVRQVLRKRRALTFGFGATVYLLLWVPVLNLFFVPLAIVGGTLLFRGLLQAGALPPPPPPRKAA